ncbi:MAG TPA: prepilin peptidase, partial [Blastocatellia bacterium]|nr:prepilin peptidase [Blastocatellia bacterium]
MFSLQDFPLIYQACFALPFGLVVGSFLNVVIYRVPRGESIAFPASHCGSCGTPVKPYDNIPLLSYAILGGRCRACRAPISWVYPAVELLTGVLFFLLAWKSGITVLGCAEMIFATVMLVLVFIDFRHQLLPNVITYPAFLAVIVYAASGATLPAVTGPSPVFSFALLPKAIIGFVLLLLAAVAFYGVDVLDNVLFGKYLELTEDDEPIDEALQDVDEEQLLRQHDRVIYTTMILGGLAALIWGVVAYWRLRPDTAQPIWVMFAVENLVAAGLGALVGGGVIWLLRAIYFYTRGFGGMGLGDVKMMAIIGAFLGWPVAILVLIFGSLAGSVVGILQVTIGKSASGLKTKLPFGVFLGAGAILALFFGAAIVRWYL